LSVAAVNEDVTTVTKIMEEIGANGQPNAEDYRLWPVFRGITTNPTFMKKFQDIFGEPIISVSTSEVTPPPSSANTDDISSLSPSLTKH
jgi:hypothetical protein